jgi:PTH1 family peptidyl-tRNA hydrolase
MIERLFKSSSGGIEFIIAGLGNPGKKYENTRHNAGYLAVDKIAESCGIPLKKVKFQALCGETRLGGMRVLLMKPTTFMNLSGVSVNEAMRYYRIPPERTLILLDDVFQDIGKLRLRTKGSSGGQNGMRNIIDMADSESFPRIKIGVGARPNPNYDLADWVLSNFTQNERKELQKALEEAAEAAELIVKGDFEAARNKFSH